MSERLSVQMQKTPNQEIYFLFWDTIRSSTSDHSLQQHRCVLYILHS